MTVLRIAAVLFAFLVGPGAAQTDPTITAQRASAMLESASDALFRAESARDRVAALSETILAFEEGLAATREALRRSRAREAAVLAALASERERLAVLIAAAQAVERAPPPLLLLHPAGPEGAARSGIILSEIAPALAQETARLRRQLEELGQMRHLQETAETDLRTALGEIQEARAQLSAAIADRVALPQRVDADTERLSAIVAVSTSLDALASALAAEPLGPLPEVQRIEAARGALPLPAFGTLLRGFGEADAAGVERPGLIIATRPNALVRAPWPGTIRFAGALPDDSGVVLLEPDGSHMIILAGLGDVYVTAGEIVDANAPLGLMSRSAQASEEVIEETGLSLSETLYIEVRVENEPVDPADWFRVARDEDR